MDRNKQWTSWTTSPIAGLTEKTKRLTVVVTATALGVAAFGSINDTISLASEVARKKSASGCLRRRFSEASLETSCMLVAGKNPVDPSHGQPEGRAALAANGLKPEAAATHFLAVARPENHANIHSDSLKSRSGLPMEKLCAANHGEMSCQIGNVVKSLPQTTVVLASAEVARFSISGRVMTRDGSGLTGIEIIAAPKSLAGRVSDAVERERFRAVTDQSGRYLLDELPPGDYIIRSAARGPYGSISISASTGDAYANIIVPGTYLADNGRASEGEQFTVPARTGQTYELLQTGLADSEASFLVSSGDADGARQF